MRFLRRLVDRLTDRRPTIRSYRPRRRSPWRLIALLVGILTLIALILGWWQMTAPPRGRVAVVSTSSLGEHSLDGRPISLRELEAELVRLKSGEEPLIVAIAGPSLNGPPAMPSPEVATLLERLRFNWMSAPQVGRAVPPRIAVELPHPSPPPPLDQGGEHGR